MRGEKEGKIQENWKAHGKKNVLEAQQEGIYVIELNVGYCTKCERWKKALLTW